MGTIVVTGTSPGPGWFPHFAPIGSWIYLGGGGGSSGGTITIPNNPSNPSPSTNCSDGQGVRQAYARSDIGYAWNERNVKPRLGSRVRIQYRNDQTERFIFNGMLAPLTPIPGSCG